MFTLHKYLDEKFQNIKFTEEQIEMIAHILRYTLDTVTIDHVNVTEAVFKEILRHTYVKDQNENVNGITRKELQEKIKVYTKINKGNSYIDGIGNLSRHMCDYCIALLTGAGLIYQDKKIQATQRGWDVAQYFKTHMSKSEEYV